MLTNHEMKIIREYAFTLVPARTDVTKGAAVALVADELASHCKRMRNLSGHPGELSEKTLRRSVDVALGAVNQMKDCK